MDSIKPRSSKTSKAKPALRHCRLQKIINGLFGLLEKTVVLIFVLRLIFEMFMALESSSEHYKELVTVIANRHFVFVIGNVVIVALFIKSGSLSRRDSDSNTSTDCIYEEFQAKMEERHGVLGLEVENKRKQSESAKKENKIIAEDKGKQGKSEIRMNRDKIENRLKHESVEIKLKQGLGENRDKSDRTVGRTKKSVTEICTKQSTREKKEEHSNPESKIENRLKQESVKIKIKQGLGEEREKEDPIDSKTTKSVRGVSTKQSTRENKEEQRNHESKIYRRTHTEKLSTSCDDSHERLRRSQTDILVKAADSEGGIKKQCYPEDEMNEMEFLNKIESFIARQRRVQLTE